MRYLVERRRTAATLVKSSGTGLSIYLGTRQRHGSGMTRENVQAVVKCGKKVENVRRGIVKFDPRTPIE